MFFGAFQQKANAQEASNLVCILGSPVTTEFPDVTVEFRATDLNYQAIKTLNHDSVTVREGGEKHVPSRINFNENATGLDIYIIIDPGSFTNLETSKAMALRFLDKYGIDGLDEVTVLSTGVNSTRVIGKSSDLSEVKSQINSIRRSGHQPPTEILEAISYATNAIRDKDNLCERPSVILVLGSVQKWSSTKFDESKITSVAIPFRTPVFFIHDVSTKNENSQTFEGIAKATKGSYAAINRSFDKDSSELDEPIFKRISNLRGKYTLTYRSESGLSGKRDISLTIGSTVVSSPLQQSSYTIDLKPPKVTLISPVEGSDIIRTATTFADPKYIYDVDVVPIEFKIEWPDKYERVPSKIRIIGVTSAGDQTIEEINETEYSRNTYVMSWNVDAITREGANPFGIRVEVIDELGLETISTPSHFTVTNLIQDAVAKQTTQEIKKDLKLTQYLVYVLSGLILAFVALAIIFRKKIKQAFSASGKIGMAIETVRKTIVGGVGRRKKPIARLEVVRPTVEVKSIFTESVKLGRDPNVSDFTFYTLNSDCSVSGEHAHLVRKRDGWKIIAVSQSESPVFVDEQRIEMHKEVPIKDGQMIELGYNDLGSALFKFVMIEPDNFLDFDPDHKFEPETSVPLDDGYRRTQVNLPTAGNVGYENSGQDDDLSMPDFFSSTASSDSDFDALFNDLRDNK